MWKFFDLYTQLLATFLYPGYHCTGPMGNFKQQELQQQSLKSARKICRKLDSTSKNCIKKNFFDYKLILKIDLDLKKSDRFYIFPKGHMVWMELNCFVEKSSSLKREWVPHLLVHNTNKVGTLVTIYIS